jgi:hypothetical protein
MLNQPVIDRDRERAFHDLELLAQFDDSRPRPATRRWPTRLFAQRSSTLTGAR